VGYFALRVSVGARQNVTRLTHGGARSSAPSTGAARHSDERKKARVRIDPWSGAKRGKGRGKKNAVGEHG
jgi:hypothetical protein